MHLRFFSRYRNLKRLSWCRSRSQFSMEGLAWHLEQQRRPQLEELCLSGAIASDQELATVVCRLPLSLKSFELGSGDFGPLCFRHLQERYFGTLVNLNLEGCDTFTSRMALDVLLNCHRLEEFKAAAISLSDLYSTPKPWVCLGLLLLKVTFINDINDNNEDNSIDRINNGNALVFEQESRLKRLGTCLYVAGLLGPGLQIQFVHHKAPERID
ncbi:hypothetical protein BGX24_001177 [Mortierella sp. AD032]|nr:hypothetical protein BGX24_001177 [Mortierella sp. AD032]